MTLSNKQTKFIDDYLKEQDVAFWDIRIELIDHVASKLEANKNLILNRNFLIKEFGTKITLSKVVSQKQKVLTRKYWNLFIKEISSCLKSPLKLMSLVLFVFTYYVVLSKFNGNIFKYASYIIFYLPWIIWATFSIFNFNKKNHSIHLHSATYFIYGSLIIQGFVTNIDTNASFDIKSLVFILISINGIWTFFGFKIYMDAYKNYTKLFDQYQKL